MKIYIEHGDDIALDHKQFIALIKSKINEELEDYDDDGHNHKAERPKFKFVDEFLKDADSYIYTVLHDCVEMVAQKYLGAEKMYFTKSFEYEIPESGLVKAMDLSEFVNKMRPFFRKAKGYFGRKKTEPLKINKKVMYNPVTGKLLTNAEFEQIANDITEFLGDRLNGTDEEIAVKSAFMGLLQRKFEQKGISHEKTKNMSYAELNEKYGVPSTIAELTEKEKLKPDSQIVRAVEFAKENAGNLLRVPQGRIRNALVDAVRQQIVQGLQENLSPQELSQRLFYTDTSDQLPANLREANINAINRDWRRVARTELSIAMNNGYLLSVADSAEPGEKKYVYYDGHFSIDDKFGSPTDCNKWLGTICLLSESPRRSGRLTGDPFAKFVVWPGKTNTDKGKTPSIPSHPHCLHWWSEINPQKHIPVIKSAKTGKILTNKDLAYHDMERDGDVYVQLVERKKK
jgi:hypothetical protein